MDFAIVGMQCVLPGSPDVDHWPVCDEAGALVGLIARADVLAALFAPQLNSGEAQR